LEVSRPGVFTRESRHNQKKRVKWQKVGMRAEDIAWIEGASKALAREPIKLEFLEEALVA